MGAPVLSQRWDISAADLRAGGRCGTITCGWVSAEVVMNTLDAEFDYERYRRLLAEATDETKRLALIDLLVNEKAKDRLALQSLRDRVAELGLTRSREDQKD
jgi:hypothetical protein